MHSALDDSSITLTVEGNDEDDNEGVLVDRTTSGDDGRSRLNFNYRTPRPRRRRRRRTTAPPRVPIIATTAQTASESSWTPTFGVVKTFFVKTSSCVVPCLTAHCLIIIVFQSIVSRSEIYFNVPQNVASRD